MSVAACLLVVSIIGFKQNWFVGEVNSNNGVAQYFTSPGQTKQVTLIDGSQITLNSGSLVSIDFNEFRRQVSLERGEVYFDVTQDKSRPFTVNVGARAVTVIGTKFNLNRSLNDFTLAVTEGKVAVHLPGESLQENLPLLEKPELDKSELDKSATKTIELNSTEQHHFEAGWVATFSQKENKLAGLAPETLESYEDWRDGMISIDGEPLFEVVKELNRHSRKKIVIENADAVGLKMYGVLRTNNIKRTLVSIEKALPIKVIHHFDRIVITMDESS
jgi:transmembrane sensor